MGGDRLVQTGLLPDPLPDPLSDRALWGRPAQFCRPLLRHPALLPLSAWLCDVLVLAVWRGGGHFSASRHGCVAPGAGSLAQIGAVALLGATQLLVVVLVLNQKLINK